jgi:HEPN domain-containing protein
MAPSTPRDFLRAAAQRLTSAEALLRERFNLDAQYLGGYTVECSLKALILHRTHEADRPTVLDRITTGSAMHRPEVLLDVLRRLGVVLPREIARRMRRFDWTTDLRYETGRRDTGETTGLLRTATAIYNWVAGEMQ